MRFFQAVLTVNKDGTSFKVRYYPGVDDMLQDFTDNGSKRDWHVVYNR